MSEGILKIQYGGVFIQLPNDLASLEFAKDFLEYWINKSTLSAINKEVEG